MAGWPPINGLLALQQEPQQNMLGGMLSPVTANRNMLAQALAARSNQQRNMLSGPTTGAEFAQNVGMVPGLGLLGVGGDIAQYIDKPETRGWLPYALTAAGALPFLGALSKMAGPMPRGLLQSQAGIVSSNRARELNTATNIPTSPDFRSAVSNTPGASIVDDGLMMSLTRNQRPEQSLEQSVRGGVFYLPEGAAQQKHYSTGRQGYGGSERITGETLISNPLVAKGGTGGKAPERAFDSLMGKDAYANMRKDALDVNWGRKTGGGTNVEDFLSKYAPELSGMGSYIVENSKQGNQLAYALQEAAVASAARRAGHDAVVGYSKGKSGPFISEVFDVREMNYPDKFGTPTEIWGKFQK